LNQHPAAVFIRGETLNTIAASSSNALALLTVTATYVASSGYTTGTFGYTTCSGHPSYATIATTGFHATRTDPTANSAGPSDVGHASIGTRQSFMSEILL
jgi:hypothetical protein